MFYGLCTQPLLMCAVFTYNNNNYYYYSQTQLSHHSFGNSTLCWFSFLGYSRPYSQHYRFPKTNNVLFLSAIPDLLYCTVVNI